MMTKIKFWQWPNVLALDASFIAVAWLWVFSHAQAATPGSTAYVVLALSVWLTYTADRLFDVSTRKEEQLLSLRHQFAKRHCRMLWLIWALFLVLNISLALLGLDSSQLLKGCILLFCCLAYTALNQMLSARFFPKELLVALIFAGGLQVFLPGITEWSCLVAFALLCLMNCLAIAWKEQGVDARLKVRSLTSVVNLRWFYALMAISVMLALSSEGALALLPSLVGLAYLQQCRGRYRMETFRVLCDAVLLIGPLVYFFGSGVLVR